MKRRTQREPYIAFPETKFAFAFHPGLPDVDAGRRIKGIVKAVVENVRGVDPLADAALDNREEYYQQKRDAARERWKKAHPGEPYPYDDDGDDDDGGGGSDGGGDAPQVKSDAPHKISDAPQVKSDALTKRNENRKNIRTYKPKPNRRNPARGRWRRRPAHGRHRPRRRISDFGAKAGR